MATKTKNMEITEGLVEAIREHGGEYAERMLAALKPGDIRATITHYREPRVAKAYKWKAPAKADRTIITPDGVTKEVIDYDRKYCEQGVYARLETATRTRAGNYRGRYV